MASIYAGGSVARVALAAGGEGKVGFGGLLFACLSRPEVSFTSDAVLRRFWIKTATS